MSSPSRSEARPGAPVYRDVGLSDDALVVVRGLRKHYRIGGGFLRGDADVVRAVDGVSLHLHRGETLGLVGESGAGKSTTGRAILRLVEPTAGTVRFDGHDVGELEGPALTRFRRRAQIVFQDPFGSLNPRLRIGSALEEAMRVNGVARGSAARRKVGETLERVGLRAEHAERFPHEFSGGQRQRIAIARALAVEPEFVVCDEPVSALDVSVQAQILNLLSELQDAFGLTYLLIAHDLSVVEHMSDRVAVMYAGRIVEQGPAERVYREPRHPYTRSLLSSVPGLDPRRRTERTVLSGEPPSPVSPPSGCPFHPRCPHPAKNEECRAAVPPLERKAPDHFAACVKESSDSRRRRSGAGRADRGRSER